MGPKPGAGGFAEVVVGVEHLATTLGSGSVEALGTPAVVALCEQATMTALEGLLRPGETTVGTRVVLDHLAAVGPGATVEARASLEKVSGRRFSFGVEVSSGDRLLAVGEIVRHRVDRERFEKGLG